MGNLSVGHLGPTLSRELRQVLAQAFLPIVCLPFLGQPKSIVRARPVLRRRPCREEAWDFCMLLLEAQMRKEQPPAMVFFSLPFLGQSVRMARQPGLCRRKRIAVAVP